MRADITDRFYRVCTYQVVDRVPDIEFGYWPQTIRRWLREGMPAELTREETNNVFCPKLNRFFGFDQEGTWLKMRTHMNPEFDTEVLETRSGSVIMRDSSGALAQRFLDDSDDSSIPHYIEFPVKGPDDWPAMKERFRLSDPDREYPVEEVNGVRQAAADGRMITAFFLGFYGQLRYWMGMENLSLAFYDFPDMVHDMVEHWAELCARQIERLPKEVVIDRVAWWEDMAGKNGPLVSPSVFREFLQPGYRRVMQAAAKRGVVISSVDCDGNPHDIVPNWLEEGVNIMFPLEVAAGVDPYAWREEFGMNLRLQGGIAKSALVQGGTAIDIELERVRPLMEQGSYIPHLDHAVPPDVPYDHYLYYLEKKRKLIGKD